MKVSVTVELELDLPPDAAREVARQMVEARGLTVTGARISTTKGEGKPFLPEFGKPGSVVDGRFVVWGDAPEKGARWATRRDTADGLYYKLTGRDLQRAQAYHADGTPHRQRCECGRVAAA